MKTHLSCLFCFIMILYGSSGLAQIQSTTTGGLWNASGTWVGGIVPGAGDDVIIKGPVQVTFGSACHNIDVEAAGSLFSYSSASWTLTVNGNIFNWGSISDNIPANTRLYINVYGDIENHGLWHNFGVYAYGNTDSYIGADQPFAMKQFFNNKPSGNFLALSSLTFNSTLINFNFKNLTYVYGYELHLQNAAELRDINLGENTFLYGDGTTLLYNVTGSLITFYGENHLGQGCSFNEAYNYGTIQNYATATATVNFSGTLENQGEIRDNPSFGDLIINFTGNLVNYGSWSNRTLNATGTLDQLLIASNPFESDFLHHLNPGFSIVCITDITFSGTNLRFYGRQLVLGYGTTVYFEGDANAEDIVVVAEGNSLYADDDYAFSNCTIDNGILSGVFNLASQCSFTGGLTINGVVQNYSSNSYTSQIMCDVYNNGTVRNNPAGGQLTIELSGNLFHYGFSWTNEETRLTGTADQLLKLLNYRIMKTSLKINSMISASSYQWQLDSSPILNSNSLFTGSNEAVLNFSEDVDDVYYGSYQCITNNGNSRLVDIVPEISGLLVNIKAYLEGPFDGNHMNSDLNSIIPLQQTLTTIGYNGTEEVIAIPNVDVVDWIGVELRDANNILLATEATTVAGGAFFILSDGSIVGLDGNSIPSFNVAINNSLFIVLWHRNHLPVISKYPLTQAGGIYTYDFTTSAGQAYGDNQSDLGGGYFGMIGGNANGDGIINESDGTEYWYPFVGKPGYLQGDVNLDGQVGNKDKNDIWFFNYGKEENLPE